MGTASFVRQLSGFTGEARLYRVAPSVAFGDGEATEFVVVSATRSMGMPETYIFPSDENGEVVDWLELDGSYKGGLDHAAALAGAGYEVTASAP